MVTPVGSKEEMSTVSENVSSIVPALRSKKKSFKYGSTSSFMYSDAFIGPVSGMSFEFMSLIPPLLITI